ncbi:GNAT family protein [Cutibacterium equinum]|uniref:GNAT family protein n=1 Tax=Cutibacterium equinum TaxID=3016342 RepID=A0ABY7QY92_9ACTN|nr:GNAT family protein [Cutibacterium equinum]WCC80001.1 GNAT family protein [Cutibacterium equinum]
MSSNDVPSSGERGRAGDVDIRPLVEEDLEWLWHWNVEVVDPQWKHWDGPYFGADDDRSFDEFAEEWRSDLMMGHRAVVTVDANRAGFVSRFEEPPVGGGWWELGIVLFQPALWGRGVGRRALRLWTEETFETTDAHVVTLTTWGGNGRMIHCANAVGYRECGRIPQARSWQGRRWDSVTMSLLRTDLTR